MFKVGSAYYCFHLLANPTLLAHRTLSAAITSIPYRFTMAVADVSKAKAIDKYLSETTDAAKLGYRDASPDSVWPEGVSKNMHKKEEDLYGYGDAAPTARLSTSTVRMPRRSSLKNLNDCPRRASIGYTGEMTLVLPTGETRRKRSSITFADDNEVREVKSVSTLVDNPHRLWFQKDEYEHIQKHIVETVEEAKKKGGERPTWVCTRGLEPIMDSSGSYERAEAKESVLGEQAMQRSHKKHDDEYIRDIYQFHTIDSQIKAHERGGRDQEEVAEYLKVTRRMCRRMSC
jgi:hypothetical protein